MNRDFIILHFIYLVIALVHARGGSKKNGKGKKGMKKGKKESYDLIVNINLDEWKLTPEQEIFSGGWTWQLYSQCVGCWTEGSLHAVWPRRGWSPFISGTATCHEVHGPETFRFSEVVFHLRFIDFKIQMSCCWRMCGRCPKTTSTTPWSSMSSCRWWRSRTRMNTPGLISSRPLGTDLQDHQASFIYVTLCHILTNIFDATQGFAWQD